MNYFIDWLEHTGDHPEKFYKTTLWQGEHVMTGLNCLEPRSKSECAHSSGRRQVLFCARRASGGLQSATRNSEAGAGTLVIAPAGVPHGVTNSGEDRLSLLVAIAPGIK